MVTAQFCTVTAWSYGGAKATKVTASVDEKHVPLWPTLSSLMIPYERTRLEQKAQYCVDLSKLKAADIATMSELYGPLLPQKLGQRSLSNCEVTLCLIFSWMVAR